MIVILCPTRGRSKKCKRMIESAEATGARLPAVNLDVMCDGRGSEKEYEQQNLQPYIRMFSPDGEPTVSKWNRLADFALARPEYKLFMLGADDMVFTTPCWDEALLDHYNSLENKIHVYHLQDSRDLNGTPHPIVTREYIEAMGYFLPPIFLHWHVDTWTVDIAKSNGCFTHMRDYMLLHDKPTSNDDVDDTHRNIRQMHWRERDASVNLTCKHFLQVEKERLQKAILV